MIIGVSGTIASGKGKISSLIRDKGFIHHSLSSEIRAIAKKRGIEINRVNLSKLGNDLRSEGKGESILALKVLEKISKEVAEGKKKFVVDGFRDPDEVNLFREHEFESGELRFVLLVADAPVETRFERLKKRGRHGDPTTFEEFKKIDDDEIADGGGQEIGKVVKMADYLIDNSKGLKELEEKVLGVLKELK